MNTVLQSAIEGGVRKHRELLLQYDAVLVNQTIEIIKGNIKNIQEAIQALNVLDIPSADVDPLTIGLYTEATITVKEKRKEMRTPINDFLVMLDLELKKLEEYAGNLDEKYDSKKLHILSDAQKAELLQQPVSVLNLGKHFAPRFHNRCRKSNIQTIQDLIQYTKKEFCDGKGGKINGLGQGASWGFGEKGVNLVIEKLAEIGLAFKKE